MLGARPVTGRAGRVGEYCVVVWIVGGAALWMAAATGVATVLGRVIAMADRDDPAAGGLPVFVPAQRAGEPACACGLDPAVPGLLR